MTTWKVVELPWRVWGRPLRPFHFGLMLATFATALQMYQVEGLPGTVLGHTAIIAVWMLLIGWASYPARRTSAWLSAWGALLALGTWAARGAYVALSDESLGVARSPVLSGILSVAWVAVAFGIWLMEQAEQDLLREEGGGE